MDVDRSVSPRNAHAQGKEVVESEEEHYSGSREIDNVCKFHVNASCISDSGCKDNNMGVNAGAVLPPQQMDLQACHYISVFYDKFNDIYRHPMALELQTCPKP
jgi:hypothetical protein